VTDYLDAGVERTRDVSSRFLHDLNAFPRSRKLMREHQLERIAGLEDLLAQGSQERAFNEIDPRVVATVILKLADTLIDPEFQAELGLTMSELCAQVYELLIHGLAPRKVAARRRKRRVPTAKHSS
ncbi:MAG: hypothetical protein HKP27_04315, partial [Myxococcales bacterium]|nr:hypothetical protein [Myxococcales bacterium]